MLLRLLEEIAHPRGADAHKHFHKIGPAQREERHAGFASNRPGKQRLSGAGRADQQSPFRYFCAKALVVFRILKKVDDFLQFLLGFIAAGDLGEVTPVFLSMMSFARLFPMPKTPSPAARKRRASRDHKPNKIKIGSTQAIRNCDKALGRVPLKLTPAACNSLTRSGSSTRTVRKKWVRRSRLGTRRDARDRTLSRLHARLSRLRFAGRTRNNSANDFVLLDRRLGHFMPRNIRLKLTVGYGDDRHLTNEFLQTQSTTSVLTK